MQFQWTKRERQLAFVFLGVILLVISLYLYDKNNQIPPSSSATPIARKEVSPNPSPEIDQPDGKTSSTIAVDIKGAVLHPGVYTVIKGARLNEVIKLAGGLLDEADHRVINLAKVMNDGELMYIPKKGEVHPPQIGNAAEPSAVDKLIPINSATLSQLGELPGIGEAKAKAILTYRTSNGPFKSKDEIKKVSGIGEKLYERMKDRISLD